MSSLRRKRRIGHFLRRVMVYLMVIALIVTAVIVPALIVINQ